MLLCSLQPKNGHVNSSRDIVDSMTKVVLFLRNATGKNKRKRHILPRILCEFGDANFSVSGFKRAQFPIRAFFAITIDKAQEQSFSVTIDLDLSTQCFTHDQLYFAMSRVTNSSNIYLFTSTKMKNYNCGVQHKTVN